MVTDLLADLADTNLVDLVIILRAHLVLQQLVVVVCLNKHTSL